MKAMTLTQRLLRILPHLLFHIAELIPFRFFPLNCQGVFSIYSLAIGLAIYTNMQHIKKMKYKKESKDFMQNLEKERNELSMKNKFIATLTHEMKNFVYR